MQLVPIENDGVAAGVLEGASELIRGVVEQTVGLYGRRGFVRPWICYLAEEEGGRVGTCGFAGPPSGGEAEIAYFTFPGHEGRGVATRMAAALLALTAPDAALQKLRIVAHTLPQEGASTRILRRLGFAMLGPVTHPEDGTVWKWRL